MESIPAVEIAAAYATVRRHYQLRTTVSMPVSPVDYAELSRACGVILAFLQLTVAKMKHCQCELRGYTLSGFPPSEAADSPSLDHKGCSCSKQVEDLAQVAWIKLEDHLQGTTAPSTNPAGYIFRLAKNCVVDEQRKTRAKKRGAGVIPIAFEEGGDNTPEPSQAQAVIEIAKAQLASFLKLQTPSSRARIADVVRETVRDGRVPKADALIGLKVLRDRTAAKAIAKATGLSLTEIYRITARVRKIIKAAIQRTLDNPSSVPRQSMNTNAGAKKLAI